MYDIYQLRQAFNYYGIYMLKLAISSYSTILQLISVFSCSVNTSALSMRLFYDSIQDDEGMS